MVTPHTRGVSRTGAPRGPAALKHPRPPGLPLWLHHIESIRSAPQRQGWGSPPNAPSSPTAQHCTPSARPDHSPTALSAAQYRPPPHTTTAPDDKGDLLLPQLLVGNLQRVGLGAHLHHDWRIHADLWQWEGGGERAGGVERAMRGARERRGAARWSLGGTR